MSAGGGLSECRLWGCGSSVIVIILEKLMGENSCNHDNKIIRAHARVSENFVPFCKKMQKSLIFQKKRLAKSLK